MTATAQWAAFAILLGGLVLGLAATAREMWRSASTRVATALASVQPPDLSTEFDDQVDQALALAPPLAVIPIADLITEIDLAFWEQELSS